jgi:myo-inositol-1(or 4)-monophosphatase
MEFGRKELEIVIEIAEQGGQLVSRMQREGITSIKGKSNDIDLVTEADVANEAFIRQSLAEHFPTIDFWGEESNSRPDSETYWVVDPIDGTVNYAKGIPYYAVNIGLQQGEEMVLAVTVELPLGRVYWALKGEGAYMRETDGQIRRLHVNEVHVMRQAILSTGVPYTRAENPDNNSVEIAHFIPLCSGIRRMGSCAIDLAQVASGAFAVHWERDLNAWDIAPGALLVREAGGIITDYDGNPWTPAERDFIASNGQPDLHQAMLNGIHAARLNVHEHSVIGEPFE